MCNFNAICRRCCHCAPSCTRNTNLDNSDARQSNEPHLSINPVSTEITSVSNTGSACSNCTRSSKGTTLSSISSKTVESIKSAANKSSNGSSLTANSIKASANGSILSSRLGSTKDSVVSTNAKNSNESQHLGIRANVQPTNQKAAVNQGNSLNCSNCYCQQWADQQRDIQNKLDAIRAEIKPNEKRQTPFSYQRPQKQKQEPPKPEKQLEKIKTKAKPKKRVKKKALVSQAITETQEGKDMWFECNVPMRVSIPNSICLGNPWDLFSANSNNLPSANNNNKLKALPAPVNNNKSLVKAARQLPSPKKPAMLSKTVRKLCISVQPMGYKPSLPFPIDEEEEKVEELGFPEPTQEIKTPKKKQKKKLPAKKKEKLINTARKGNACCYSLNSDQFKELCKVIGRNSGSRKPSIDKTIKETSKKASNNYSMNSDNVSNQLGKYSTRIGSISYSTRDSSSLNGTNDSSITDEKLNTQLGIKSTPKDSETPSRTLATQQLCECFSISENKINNKPRIYASQKFSEDSSISENKINYKPRIYTTEKGSEDSSISENKINQKPRIYTSRVGSRNFSISDDKPKEYIFPKYSLNSPISKDQSMDNTLQNGDYASRKGSEYNTLSKDLVTHKSCNCNEKENQERSLSNSQNSRYGLQSGENGDFSTRKGSEYKDLVNHKSCHCSSNENQERSPKSVDGESRNSQISPYHVADPGSGHCSVIEHLESYHEPHRSINAENGDSQSRNESKTYLLNREDRPAFKSCHCSIIKNQNSSFESCQTTDGECRNPKRAFNDMGNPCLCRQDLSQDSHLPANGGSNITRNGFYDMTQPRSCHCSEIRMREPEVVRKTVSEEQVPFHKAPRPSNSESSTLHKVHSFVSGRYPSPAAWNFDQMQYSVSSVLLRTDLNPKRSSQASHKSYRPSAQSSSLPQRHSLASKHRKDSDHSISSHRSIKRSSDKSVVSRKLRRILSERDSASDSSVESVKSSRSNRVSLGKFPSSHNSARSSRLSNLARKSQSSNKSKYSQSSLSESIGSHRSKNSWDAQLHHRRSGGRNISEDDWNILAQFIKMFSEQHSEPTKHLADKSTYVRTIDRNKRKWEQQNLTKIDSSRHTNRSNDCKECRRKSVESEKFQQLIADMPRNSYNRLVELLNQGNKNIDKQQRSTQVMNANQSQLFYLLSTLSPSTKSLKQREKQLKNDHIPAIHETQKLSRKHKKVFEQNKLPESEHDKAKEIEQNLSYREEHRKRKHRSSQNINMDTDTADNKFHVKDLKICLLRQDNDNSPPVLEEYNVEAFTRSPSLNSSQRSCKKLQLANGKSKRYSRVEDREKLHAINEENVQVVWSDLKRFCRENYAKSSDMLQKPVVLVPYRPDNEINRRMVCICKPDEWKELKIPRTAASRRAERVSKCGHPRKYTRETSSAVAKSKISICSKAESKLYECLRNVGKSNRSQDIETPLCNCLSNEQESKTLESKNRTQLEAESQTFSMDHDLQQRSQSLKSCLPQLHNQQQVLESLCLAKNELRASSRANSLSKRSKSPRLRSSRTEEREPERKRSRETSIANCCKGRHSLNLPQTKETERLCSLINSLAESDEGKGVLCPESVYPLHNTSNKEETAAPNNDIVMHLKPRLMCCRSNIDLRCLHQLSNKEIPSSSAVIGQIQSRNSKERQSQGCIGRSACSTNMSRDLQHLTEMQLQQALRQANLEFDRTQQHFKSCERVEDGKMRQEETENICCIGQTQEQLQQALQQANLEFDRTQQQFQSCERVEDGKMRQEERENICCIGHTQEQLQQALQQANLEFDRRQQQQYEGCERVENGKKRREEAEFICCIGHTQEQLQQRQQQKQQRLQQQQQIQQLHQHIQQRRIQQQQQLQQHRQQENEYNCGYSCSQNLQEQQQYHKEKSCYCQHSQQLLTQQQQDKALQQLQHTLEEDKKRQYVDSAFFQRQQQHMHRQQQHHLKLQEENCYSKCWQNPQQQQAFNCSNCLLDSVEPELQCVPCCYYHIAPQPDLSNIRSSFYQQTLLKYGIQRLPDDYLKQIPSDTVCCGPCCTCCACAYGQQQ